LFTVIVLALLVALLYPRSISVSFPVAKLVSLLKLDNGNSVYFDMSERKFYVKTNWPVTIENWNLVSLSTDEVRVDLYYPGAEGLNGVHMAHATADDLEVKALRSTTNWVAVDSAMHQSVVDSARMTAAFSADCAPCLNVFQDCVATTVFFAQTEVHLATLDKLIGAVNVGFEFELGCDLLIGGGDDDRLA
jgi:hypothetical protein